MALTPVEVRHIQLKRGLFGYRKSAVHRMMEDIADSFETVWRERSQLVERVEELETEVARHVELEGLLRSTLVSAEKASRDLKEAAQREADVIVTEANAEARKVLRDAITEKEMLISDVQRVQAVLRSALSVVNDAPTNTRGSAPVREPLPAPVAEPAPAALSAPVAEPAPKPMEMAAPEPAPPVAPEPPMASDEMPDTGEDALGGQMANWPIGGRPAAPAPSPFELPAQTESTGEIRKVAG